MGIDLFISVRFSVVSSFFDLPAVFSDASDW